LISVGFGSVLENKIKNLKNWLNFAKKGIILINITKNFRIFRRGLLVYRYIYTPITQKSNSEVSEVREVY